MESFLKSSVAYFYLKFESSVVLYGIVSVTPCGSDTRKFESSVVLYGIVSNRCITL